MKSSYRYIIFSSMCLFFGIVTTTAQETEKKDTLNHWWHGVIVAVDIAPIVGTQLTHPYAHIYQAMAQANLANKYFPLIEYGIADIKKNINNTSYQAQGMYGKVGIDFNLLKNKNSQQRINNYILAGVRVGASPFKYSIANQTIDNPYWGGKKQIDSYDTQETKVWLELSFGLQVAVYKNIYMGWSLRNKRIFGKTTDGEPTPWYIPGYGINQSANWGMDYTIGYRF